MCTPAAQNIIEKIQIQAGVSGGQTPQDADTIAIMPQAGSKNKQK